MTTNKHADLIKQLIRCAYITNSIALKGTLIKAADALQASESAAVPESPLWPERFLAWWAPYKVKDLNRLDWVARDSWNEAVKHTQPVSAAVQVAQEREECAKVCDTKYAELASRAYPPPKILRELSATIRARYNAAHNITQEPTT